MALPRRTLLATALATLPARAQPVAQPVDEPVARETRIVVGFPLDGPLDIAARTIAPPLAARLAHPVAVENHPGASGNTATAQVVQAAPDGRTLLLCGPVHTINTTLFENLPFDFARDIAPVAPIARVPLVIEVNPAIPVRTPPEFLAWVRANPGRLRVAYAGSGTPQHIGIELFQLMAAAKVTLIPFPGSAPALAALLAGDADAMFDPAPSSMPHIRAGRLIPIATTGPTPAEMLPDVPALAEVLPGYEAGSWFGLGAPRATPAPVIDAINRAVTDSLADPAIQAAFRELGATTTPATPAEFGRFIAAETEKYRHIIRTARITVPG